MNNYTGSNYQKWELIKVAEYFAVVNNYFDKGYYVNYGETSVASIAKLNSYMDTISARYLTLLGVQISRSNATYYNSIIDTCKNGNVISSNLDTLCSHAENHTGLEQVKSAFEDFTTPRNSITRKVYWTGHRVTTPTSDNRSYCFANDFYMLEKSSSVDRDVDSIGIMVHELNHTFGARDHYHEELINDNGTAYCRNKSICSICGSNPRPATCIMNNSRGRDISETDILCDTCKEDMLYYILRHIN
ncbi:hypothetical protein FACS1894132_06980 [Clostridia bacterium]|nr:hypothetical protein FACS1894132_06980 [Clostridia bacterium]